MSRRYEELTGPDILDRISASSTLVLPIGAVEQHGPHLPLAVDHVAFHEVGAIDSIADIVGTAAALAWLAPASVTCAAVTMGYGSVTCAHGKLPVPSPAALEIIRQAGGVVDSVPNT